MTVKPLPATLAGHEVFEHGNFVIQTRIGVVLHDDGDFARRCIGGEKFFLVVIRDE